ncbi:selT/selW/selH selenoprotein domain protein [Hartmannibacter diazotrophicus]|uniref:SelT/selW/selH selenoprotein domain protein n=1 Tax=Hartmannibacter diazotrophicus TaxID=1482074 RepID=A0A2C9D8G6_9HYPH|nr:SelT/SelW/SelH family protein [Hartmannibacter diazotrophicus]SON56533.1 selT/selW/selH selenoprotein domain protein [Hartmannibacter diazotrophicus]
MSSEQKPTVTIAYCRQCHWLPRAAWMAQEVLHTFSEEVGAVTLIPGTGGIYEVHCDGNLIWERKRDGGFPDAAELKRRIRNLIDPDRDLGHVDHKEGPAAGEDGGSHA